MSRSLVPSVPLLRTFLQPSKTQCTACQTRSTHMFMPRHKYAKPNRLDKLHRQQKDEMRRQKEQSEARALLLEESLKAAAVQAPTADLPYHMGRTRTKNFPVYETVKYGGSKQITTLRHLSGDLTAMQSELCTVLGLPLTYSDGKGRKKENVAINDMAKHIVIKGWRGAEVKRWAGVLGF